MSWQAYVDSSLVATGQLDKAAIFSGVGDSKWAGSQNFEVSSAEAREICAAFEDTSDPKKVQSTGFHVAGEKYVVIKADKRSLYGMKGKTGVVCVKTGQAILVAHHPEGIQTQQAAYTVETLADHLIGAGY